MKRQVLIYSLVGGVLIASLKWAEYRSLSLEETIEAKTIALRGAGRLKKLTIAGLRPNLI